MRPLRLQYISLSFSTSWISCFLTEKQHPCFHSTALRVTRRHLNVISSLFTSISYWSKHHASLHKKTQCSLQIFAESHNPDKREEGFKQIYYLIHKAQPPNLSLWYQYGYMKSQTKIT